MRFIFMTEFCTTRFYAHINLEDNINQHDTHTRAQTNAASIAAGELERRTAAATNTYSKSNIYAGFSVDCVHADGRNL